MPEILQVLILYASIKALRLFGLFAKDGPGKMTE